MLDATTVVATDSFCGRITCAVHRHSGQNVAGHANIWYLGCCAKERTNSVRTEYGHIEQRCAATRLQSKNQFATRKRFVASDVLLRNVWIITRSEFCQLISIQILPNMCSSQFLSRAQRRRMQKRRRTPIRCLHECVRLPSQRWQIERSMRFRIWRVLCV